MGDDGTVGEDGTEWARLRAGLVVLEDEAVLVLNKPAGVSVTGDRHETDLVRLARAAGEELYPVHRIDKATSGAVLLAKELRWHGGLTRQFGRRTVAKAYLAITRPAGLPEAGTIDLPLSVGRKNRVRVAAPREAISGPGPAGTWSVPAGAVFGHVRVYPSLTRFRRVWQDGEQALLAVWPVTGRRHQIRVHLAWIGYPVAGDPLFAASATRLPRAHLHSWRLAFDAAWRAGVPGAARQPGAGGPRLRVEAAPGADFWAPLGPGPGEDPAALLATARRYCEEMEASVGAPPGR